jgi:hypothetical protein
MMRTSRTCGEIKHKVKESNLGQIHKNQQNPALAGLETGPDQILGQGRAGFCWAWEKPG